MIPIIILRNFENKNFYNDITVQISWWNIIVYLADNF